MLPDVEIARQAQLRPITEIAAGLGLAADELRPFGHHIAKVPLAALAQRSELPDGKLVLVTAVTPTRYGEGKTLTTVSLGQALGRLGQRSIICLREPSLGPVFGIKGGAAGGGYSQVVPMEAINLHFTGDLHAVSAAHNLLSALLDASLHFGNPHDIDVNRVTWPRAVDMNDRVLRNAVVGLGGRLTGVPREDRWVITAASEVMAVLCLAESLADLRERLGRIVVGYTCDERPVFARDLEAHHAMALLLREALEPNLVQTLEGTPALIHGGPFGNIAHGTNSLLADRLALKLADIVVTECGFGADLGAEKFMNIVARQGQLCVATAVVVATVRALKVHGGIDERDGAALASGNMPALEAGFANLARHVENMRKYGMPVVVALNRFASDSDAEMARLGELCDGLGVEWAVHTGFADGGAGAAALAELVVRTIAHGGPCQHPLYELHQPLEEKIDTIAREIYGARVTVFDKQAKKAIARLEANGFGGLPVCIAKTQSSISDNPARKGVPSGYKFQVRDAYVSNGAGFVVAIAGQINQMPGLGRTPAATGMRMADDGTVSGLA